MATHLTRLGLQGRQVHLSRLPNLLADSSTQIGQTLPVLTLLKPASKRVGYICVEQNRRVQAVVCPAATTALVMIQAGKCMCYAATNAIGDGRR